MNDVGVVMIGFLSITSRALYACIPMTSSCIFSAGFSQI